MVVAASVVSNAGVPPELVESESTSEDVSVVEFVVVADPATDKSPGGLDTGIGSETSNLLGLASCV